eukprot:956167-Pelagomonas_calceolata.AAC.1
MTLTRLHSWSQRSFHAIPLRCSPLPHTPGRVAEEQQGEDAHQRYAGLQSTLNGPAACQTGNGVVGEGMVWVAIAHDGAQVAAEDGDGPVRAPERHGQASTEENPPLPWPLGAHTGPLHVCVCVRVRAC